MDIAARACWREMTYGQFVFVDGTCTFLASIRGNIIAVVSAPLSRGASATTSFASCTLDPLQFLSWTVTLHPLATPLGVYTKPMVWNSDKIRNTLWLACLLCLGLRSTLPQASFVMSQASMLLVQVSQVSTMVCRAVDAFRLPSKLMAKS